MSLPPVLLAQKPEAAIQKNFTQGAKIGTLCPPAERLWIAEVRLSVSLEPRTIL